MLVETEQTRILEEILKWVRFQGLRLANETITKTIIKDSEKLAYQFSDGRPSTEIANLSGVSDFTVRAYWKAWAPLGLVEPSANYKGRYERVFSLEQFGIEIPPPKSQSGITSDLTDTSRDATLDQNQKKLQTDDQ